MFRRLFGLVCVMLLASCGGGKAPDSAAPGGTLPVGVAGPMTGDLAQFGESLKNGVTLAFEEINAAGGVLGRQLKLVPGDDQAKSNEGVNVARNFVRDPQGIRFVIGHFNSGISIPAGEIYNQAGILMLTPASTNPAVTSPEKPFVFRNLPNDAQNGRMLAQFVVGGLGAKRIGIYFANDEYGKGLAAVVKQRLGELGVTVVDEASYDPNADEDFRPVLTRWKGLRLDAIVLAAENPKGAQLIKQARELGLTVPFAGGDGIASSELWTIGGAAGVGTYVVSYFHPGNPDPAVREFVAKYTQRYGREPDVWAAQAYDAARVLCDAITRAGAPDPNLVRVALAATDGWRGVTGPHRFRNGDAVGKRVIITCVGKVNEAGDLGFVFDREVAEEEGN